MTSAYKALCGGAIMIAAGLLAVQIMGGIEYTQGGTAYTRVSMIAAMVTLAALPIFIEAARRIGATGVAVALFVAFLAFLAYSLPANIGRTGEIKEAKVVAAGDAAEARRELASINTTLSYALPDMTAECIGAPEPLPPNRWPECRRKRGTVEALKERRARIETTIHDAPVSGDVGSEVIAWASAGVLPATAVRMLGIIGFALGLDVAIWALSWFVSHVVSLHSSPVPKDRSRELPPTDALEPDADNVADWAKAFRSKHGRSPSIPEVQSAFPDCPKTTAWRKAKAA